MMEIPEPTPCFFIAQEWRTQKYVLGYVSPSGRRYTLPDRCPTYTQGFARLMLYRQESGHGSWPVIARFPEAAICGAETMVAGAFAGREWGDGG